MGEDDYSERKETEILKDMHDAGIREGKLKDPVVSHHRPYGRDRSVIDLMTLKAFVYCR